MLFVVNRDKAARFLPRQGKMFWNMSKGGLKMQEDVLLRSSGIVWSDLDGDTVLLDAEAGTYYTLNEVAASVWDKIDGKRAIGEILDLMLEEYDVDRATLEKDLDGLVADLLDKGLIERKKRGD
jgi:hypothetical protein